MSKRQLCVDYAGYKRTKPAAVSFFFSDRINQCFVMQREIRWGLSGGLRAENGEGRSSTADAAADDGSGGLNS